MANPIDNIGDRFGKLVIVSRSGVIGTSAAWLCLCDCGEARTVRSQDLRTGKTKGCKRCNWNSNRMDLSGLKIGPWTVLAPSAVRSKLYSWSCRHEDGHEAVVSGATLYLYRNPEKRLVSRYRNRLAKAMRRGLYGKKGRTLDLLGCSAVELYVYISERFRPGMTMDNYGKWHIDHIKPVASYDLRDPEQTRECFHYTNLQPLWAIENLIKGSKTGK